PKSLRDILRNHRRPRGNRKRHARRERPQKRHRQRRVQCRRPHKQSQRHALHAKCRQRNRRQAAQRQRTRRRLCQILQKARRRLSRRDWHHRFLRLPARPLVPVPPLGAGPQFLLISDCHPEPPRGEGSAFTIHTRPEEPRRPCLSLATSHYLRLPLATHHQSLPWLFLPNLPRQPLEHFPVEHLVVHHPDHKLFRRPAAEPVDDALHRPRRHVLPSFRRAINERPAARLMRHVSLFFQPPQHRPYRRLLHRTFLRQRFPARL